MNVAYRSAALIWKNDRNVPQSFDHWRDMAEYSGCEYKLTEALKNERTNIYNTRPCPDAGSN